MELGPLQKAWIAALRSGEYRQVRGSLCRFTEDGKLGFCCLGVARVAGGMTPPAHPEDWPSYLGDEEAARIGLRNFAGMGLNTEPLARINDRYGATFAEIADLLEANPAEYFERSV